MTAFAPTAYAPTAYFLPVAGAAPPPGDTTPPVLAGQLAVSGISHNSATLIVPTASDNVGVVGYERSLDGGATYAAAGTLPTIAVSGLTPATTYQARVRAYDAAGNRSDPLAASFSTAAAPVEPPTGGFDATKAAVSRTVIFTGGIRTVRF